MTVHVCVCVRVCARACASICLRVHPYRAQAIGSRQSRKVDTTQELGRPLRLDAVGTDEHVRACNNCVKHTRSEKIRSEYNENWEFVSTITVSTQTVRDSCIFYA